MNSFNSNKFHLSSSSMHILTLSLCLSLSLVKPFNIPILGRYISLICLYNNKMNSQSGSSLKGEAKRGNRRREGYISHCSSNIASNTLQCIANHLALPPIPSLPPPPPLLPFSTLDSISSALSKSLGTPTTVTIAGGGGGVNSVNPAS